MPDYTSAAERPVLVAAWNRRSSAPALGVAPIARPGPISHYCIDLLDPVERSDIGIRRETP